MELVETIERSKQIYPKVGAVFTEKYSLWRFPNGARLRFSYLERDSDADNYQGWSITRLYIEEAGTFPSERAILKLKACLRSGHGVPVKMIATGNPGGAGQHWVKDRWIDKYPKGNKIFERSFKNPFTGETTTEDWCFIPSFVTDNKYLCDTNYVAQLHQVGSPQLVRAWLQGDWDAVEGAYFAEWDQARHVIPAGLVDITKLDGLFFRSVDIGFAAPFSVGWWCHLQDDYDIKSRGNELPGDVRGFRGTLPGGALLRIGEYYGARAPNVGIRLPAETLARNILKRDPLKFEKFSYTVIDPSAFKEEGGPSIAERMGNEGLICRPADNKRLGQWGYFGGWDVMRQRLIGDVQGKPMIACLDTCHDSIRTIPTLQHDPDKAEDLDTEQEDHAADEWRYAVMSRPWHKHTSKSDKKVEFKDYSRSENQDSWVTDWVTM
jgi:hypothetical protein